jgi:alkylation response protein AidB-like acyl-CoA dehydrogenase
MNFELSDEQVFLQEAARGALSRHKTVENAREALEGSERLDLSRTVIEAGWPGLLISEEHGGAGLSALESMLVMAECGRVLAPVNLLGLLPATALLDADGSQADLLARLAEGEVRATFVAARPPDSLEEGWTVEPRRGSRRAPAPRFAEGKLSGDVAWVPDAPGAEVLVVAATGEEGPVAVLVEDGAAVEEVIRYDATRSLGHVSLDGAPGTALDVTEHQLAAAWYLAQGLVAAEALGAVEECLGRSVAYAKERFTFGRAIGSYQAVKHALVEVLRRLENTRSLIYYAGWSFRDAPEEFPLAASAARTAAGSAFDYAARELISVHGGIGATWEHDAPLYFRRSQLSRRLLGGTGDASDRVADVLLAGAAKL